MTPAIEALEATGTAFRLHRYEPDAGQDLARHLADALAVAPERVFKTLILESDGQVFAALVPASRQLNLKAAARLCGAKRAQLAPQGTAERTTGYLRGAISPFGQKTRLPMLGDDSLIRFSTVFVSAGRRGLELELAPGELVRLCSCRLGALCPTPG